MYITILVPQTIIFSKSHHKTTVAVSGSTPLLTSAYIAVKLLNAGTASMVVSSTITSRCPIAFPSSGF